MKVSLSLVLSFLFYSSTVVSFGIRGAAERAVYFASYMTEDIFQTSDRKLAVGCVGSRTTLLGVKGRCNLVEFLDYIWRASPMTPGDTKPDIDKVMIGDRTYKEGKDSGDWGSLGDLEAKSPADRVSWMTNSIEQIKTKERWMLSNGQQKTQKDGSLVFKTPKLKGNGYSAFFDTVKLEGKTRGLTPADFANFVKEFGEYQKRAKERLNQITMTDDTRAKFMSWHTTIVDAVDNVIELRMAEMSRVSLPQLESRYGPVVKKNYVGRFQTFLVLDEALTHGGDATKKAKLEADLLALQIADGGAHQGAVDGWNEAKGTLSCS